MDAIISGRRAEIVGWIWRRLRSGALAAQGDEQVIEADVVESGGRARRVPNRAGDIRREIFQTVPQSLAIRDWQGMQRSQRRMGRLNLVDLLFRELARMKQQNTILAVRFHDDHPVAAGDHVNRITQSGGHDDFPVAERATTALLLQILQL